MVSPWREQHRPPVSKGFDRRCWGKPCRLKENPSDSALIPSEGHGSRRSRPPRRSCLCYEDTLASLILFVLFFSASRRLGGGIVRCSFRRLAGIRSQQLKRKFIAPPPLETLGL